MPLLPPNFMPLPPPRSLPLLSSLPTSCEVSLCMLSMQRVLPAPAVLHVIYPQNQDMAQTGFDQRCCTKCVQATKGAWVSDKSYRSRHAPTAMVQHVFVFCREHFVPVVILHIVMHQPQCETCLRVLQGALCPCCDSTHCRTTITMVQPVFVPYRERCVPVVIPHFAMHQPPWCNLSLCLARSHVHFVSVVTLDTAVHQPQWHDMSLCFAGSTVSLL